MEHKDNKPNVFEQIRKMSSEEIATSITNAVKNIDPDFIEKSRLFLSSFSGNINKFMNLIKNPAIFKTIESLQIILPVLPEFEKLMKSNPKFEEMSLDEAIETEEFKQFIEEFNRRRNDDSAQFSSTTDNTKYNSMPVEALIILNSIIPQNHIKPNNKLANEIICDFINEGEQTLRVSRSGAKKEITTKAILTYEGKNISLEGRVKFTSYDREVHDAVVTLYVAGNEVITPEMVYRAMNGMTETEYVSPQSIGAVTRSLDKSRKTTLNIDFSQEAEAYKKDCKATYEGYLLACDKITVSTGGRTKEAYKLLRKPILYDYAQVSGQIINVPIKLLQTKEAVRSTDEVIVIRGYLLRQIEGIKSPTFKRSNKITFDGIYTELEMDGLSEKAFSDKSLKIRKHVEAILKEWVNQKYIKEYKQYREGKILKGVDIAI